MIRYGHNQPASFGESSEDTGLWCSEPKEACDEHRLGAPDLENLSGGVREPGRAPVQTSGLEGGLHCLVDSREILVGQRQEFGLSTRAREFFPRPNQSGSKAGEVADSVVSLQSDTAC